MSKFHPLTIADVRNETRDTIAVTFTVPPELQHSFQYQQGQHLTLRAKIGDEDVRRSYSICSAVQDRALYESLLREVRDAGDVLPEARLSNRIAKRRAERYLRFTDQRFP